MPVTTIAGAEIRAPLTQAYQEILTPETMTLLVDLVRQFRPSIKQALGARAERQQAFDDGALPEFLAETRSIRDADWTVAPIPAELQQRMVELTGPADRRVLSNAIASSADGFMVDFEDAHSPTWEGEMRGLINLKDAVQGRINADDRAETDHLGGRGVPLWVRPRGLHRAEKHVHVDGEQIPAALFDFALHLGRNASTLLARDSAPYFYLPKLESHQEAALWRDVFAAAESTLEIAPGTIRCTVSIETLPAAFEMDEILYALRDHAVALNFGCWNYIFSVIKCFRRNPDWVTPDRHALGPEQPFLDACSKLLCVTCHRRGALAIGAVSPDLPVRNDESAHQRALSQVRADKTREVENGHDGTWVAHPELINAAKEPFAARLTAGNQLDRELNWQISAEDLLAPPRGEITDAGLRNNIAVGIQYLEAWISGRGCLPLYNLMEDASTVEIARTQVWQWAHHPVSLSDGRDVSAELIVEIMHEEMDNIAAEVGEAAYGAGRFAEAAELFQSLCLADDCVDFMTAPAYELLV